MPFLAVAQRHGVGLAVGRDFPFFQHLRLDLVVGVGGQQGVVDHVAVPRRDVRSGGMRIGQAQRRVHHRFYDGLGVGAVSHHEGRARQGGGSDELQHESSP
ncbi:hypothetical protein D9M70_598900 [compost metagenome]